MNESPNYQKLHQDWNSSQPITREEKILRRKKWEWFDKFHDPKTGLRKLDWISFEEWILTDKK